MSMTEEELINMDINVNINVNFNPHVKLGPENPRCYKRLRKSGLKVNLPTLADILKVNLPTLADILKDIPRMEFPS